MQHSVQLEGFGVRLRPARAQDAAFIVWLRGLDHARGRIGDTTPDIAGQLAWMQGYFERGGDYYFIIETERGIPVGTQGVYDIRGNSAEVGRWVIRPGVQAAIPSYVLILDFAFKQLGLAELRATTIVSNRAMISLNRKVGFENFRIEPHGRVINGEPVDIVHCVLRAETWFRTREVLVPMAQVAERLVREWEQEQLRIHPEQRPAEIYGPEEKPRPPSADRPGPARTAAWGVGTTALLLSGLILGLGLGPVRVRPRTVFCAGPPAASLAECV
ncbi:MAG: GNAT family N-acetyltransferase [Verrucomicrobiae bacterium]|nr:GNAT family N-acetyltransferase [Verrucomicrobiae bacterium]MDW8308838.1 GNAT family N-acetyltransferase [Verrucomicrobiales bacterium]